MEKKGSLNGPYIPLPVADSSATPPKASRFQKLLSVVLVLVNIAIFHLFFLRPASRLLFGSPTLFNAHPGKKFIWGKEAEKLYLSIPDEASAMAASRLYTHQPHPAGSDGDFETAMDFLNMFQEEWGISASGAGPPIYPAGSAESRDATLSIPKTKAPKAWMDVYYPVMNTPLDRKVEVIDEEGNSIWTAELEEVADDTDPEAGQYFDAVPAFHGLSAQGDVQGKLIYANYGRKEDYDALVAKGVNFTGSIVITRYGAIFRGLKVKGAQELGAAGCLIYSDLRDDGTVLEENGYLPYPNGPARNLNSVQRGSVQFLSKYPGDPTTPGYPSYENSTRTEGENIPKIPSIPISAANAAKLLELAGKGKEVHLVNNVDTRVMPIWNVMGVIPGFITDQIVMLGNHRDAWVMGGADPSSGTASTNEVVRGLGALLKKGWKPLRTIVIASWDAEEYGLIGSTEWAEDFSEFIGAHVVTYLNLDSAISGSRFSASASPSLSHFLRETALEIPHPTDAGRSLWDARSDTGPFFGDNFDAESMAANSIASAMTDDLGVAPLGSGSDFTAFLQVIGVASSDASFGGAPGDAVYHYHSVFDSQHWQENFADPGFFRHVAVSKHVGLELIRLASLAVLPLNTTHYSYELQNYLNGIDALEHDVQTGVDLAPLRKSILALQAASHSLDFEKASAEKELKKMIRKWAKHHSQMRKKLHKIICRIKKVFGGKCKKQFSGKGCSASSTHSEMEMDSAALGVAAHAGFDVAALPKWPLAKFKKVVKRIHAVNQKLVSFERGFISKDGIPDREWYKHLAIAPGKWLGYGATPMPALSEAIEYEKNVTLAQYEVKRLTDLITALADTIRVHE